VINLLSMKQISATIVTDVEGRFRSSAMRYLNNKQFGLAVTAAMIAFLESDQQEEWIARAEAARRSENAKMSDAMDPETVGRITPAVESRQGAAKKKPRPIQSTEVSPKQPTGRVKKKRT